MDRTLQRPSVWRTILIAVLGFVALAAWGLSSPAGSSPDDDYHLTSIWCAQGERAGLCENVTTSSVEVPNNVVHAPCFAYHKDVTGACQATLGTEMVSIGRANILEHSYPPGFYRVMSLFTSHDVAASVMLMRLFNAALFVAMATVTFLLIERRWRGPLGLGIAVTIVPLGMFIIPSTNPSSWTLYAPAFIFLLVRTALERPHSGKRLTALVLASTAITLIASSARSDAALYAVFAALLAACITWRTVLKNKAFYLSIIPVVVIAGWSLLAGHQVGGASSGLSGDTAAARTSVGLLVRNILELPGLYAGVSGTWGLGWLDTPMPAIVWVSGVILIGGVVFSAIAFKRARGELFVPGIALAFMAFVPLAISQLSGAAIGSYVQPRYVLALLALALVALATTATPQLLSSRRQLAIVAVVVTLANAIALGTNAIRYAVGLQTANINPGSSSWAVLAPSVATVALGAVAAGMLCLRAYRSSDFRVLH